MLAIKFLLLISTFLVPVTAQRRVPKTLENEHPTLAARISQARSLKKDKDKKVNIAENPDEKKKDKKGDTNNDTDNLRNPDQGGGTSVSGLAESHDCLAFEEGEVQNRASLSQTDLTCLSNNCGKGCCRVFHWLICDESNAMPQLPCVCNENTKIPPTNPPTPYPTLASIDQLNPADTPDLDLKISVTPEPTKSPSLFVVPAPITSPPVVPATPEPVPAEVTATEPPYVGVAAAESCAGGSRHQSNPLFDGFTKCFSASDCPLSTECCIHSFCFCGQPDNWDGDCIAPE